MKPMAFLAPLLLAGCIHTHPDDAPPPFISLNAGVPFFADLAASATQITPDIAATARHAKWLAPGSTWDATTLPDIAYYRTSQGKPVGAVDPVLGEAVTAWGTSPWCGCTLSVSGHVIARLVTMRRFWGDSALGFVFDHEAPSGFSGGPVFNAHGDLVGIMSDTITLDDGRKGTFAYWSVDVLKAEPK